tara:strand:+ start:462 stop:665 length:204 start_codon:yes stop_codon:yes gene_type:complete
MNWLYSLLLLPLLPFAFVGYYKLAKKGIQNELEEQVDTIENKVLLTEEDKQFLLVAKEYLNNLNKND